MGNIDDIDDIDDQHRNTNMNNKDHLLGQLTRGRGVAQSRHCQVCSRFFFVGAAQYQFDLVLAGPF